AVSNSQQPLLTDLSEGLHQLKLVVRSVYGCESDTATQTFSISPQPVVDMIVANGCRDKPISFTGLQLDNNTTITKWNWNFGDGKISNQQNPVHSYSQVGQITVQLNATANGCTSADVTKSIYVAFVDVTTMNDTIALPNTPFKIGNSFSSNTPGATSFAWAPATGLDNPTIMSPTATLQDDIKYIVIASTMEGCIGKDTLNVEIFKGSAVYVPTAFTPNNDGLNDKLRPSVTGIKRLDYFNVYNRWGQVVFSTSKIRDGWDGKVNSINQQTGTFVWRLRAEDVIGKIYEMRGSTTILR
ncbi:MAG TPA: PKD domain-containing protein, partial [Niastella sp.]|nr:PKD domain-containing protein [Niastella sp.]